MPTWKASRPFELCAEELIERDDGAADDGKQEKEEPEGWVFEGLWGRWGLSTLAHWMDLTMDLECVRAC